VSNEYNLSDAQADTSNLLSGASFAALPWRTQAVCSYDASGSGAIDVAKSALGTTTSVANTNTTCSGSPANAALGYASNATSNGGWTFSMSTAQIDVCGPYCTRTYDCTASPPTVTCVNGAAVDGYAPVTLAVPAIPSGETSVSVHLFPGGQCA
jgi:hypothetical protein